MPTPQESPEPTTPPNAERGRCLFAWLTVWAMILAALTQLALNW